MTEVLLPHNINYKFEGSVRVDEVISSLQSQKELLKYVAPVLEDVFPGLTVKKLDLRVNEINAGSLTENFFVAALLLFQTDIEAVIAPWVEKQLNTDLGPEAETVITLIVLLVVLWMGQLGIAWVKSKTSSSKGKPVSGLTINGDYNTVLNLAAEKLQVDPDDLDQGVKRSVGSTSTKEQRITLSRFLRPTRNKNNASIEGADGVGLSSNTIEEIPVSHMEADQGRSHQVYYDAKIRIIALDRTRKRLGWACELLKPDFTGQRVKLALMEYVDIKDADTDKTVNATISVEFTDDNYNTPTMCHLIEVINYDDP